MSRKVSNNPIYATGYRHGVDDMAKLTISSFYEELKEIPGIGEVTFKKIEKALEDAGDRVLEKKGLKK